MAGISNHSLSDTLREGAAVPQDAALAATSGTDTQGSTSPRSASHGRSQTIGHGWSGASREVQRPRALRDADDADHAGDGNDGSPKSAKRRRANTPDTTEVYPVEIHRRKISLRERLISGEFEPQAVGMRVYNMKKAAASRAAAASRRKATREFLVPNDPQSHAAAQREFPTNEAGNSTNASDAADVQSNPRIAYKSTPIHQLHFPEGLVLALKQNIVKWEDKKHSAGLVFVVVHLINSDVADMHVFSTLRDATADAIWVMINEHPEAFSLPRTVDDEGVEIKFEKYQRAASLLRDINARPNAVRVPMPAVPAGHGHTGDSQNAGAQGSGSAASFEEEDSLFVIKEEDDPELPRPSRYTSPRPDLNNRGELLLGDTPEPTYVFCGKFRIVSFGLKMEARRADGAVVKVSVHLKNLRKPVAV